MPNIPAQGPPALEELLLAVLYRDHNAIERMFCQLKDFRRVATRYDRNAVNFLAAVCIAAVSYWLCVSTLER
jgi:transposase